MSGGNFLMPCMVNNRHILHKLSRQTKSIHYCVNNELNVHMVDQLYVQTRHIFIALNSEDGLLSMFIKIGIPSQTVNSKVISTPLMIWGFHPRILHNQESHYFLLFLD